MALKGKWVDKVNGVDMNNADDINQVAHAVMELEEKESGGISQETDPTVPSWAKQANKPKYTASEVGADARGTAVSAVSAHNVDDESHQDIRILLSELKSAVNAFLDIDDETYDQLSELIQKIEENADSIEKITNGKVNVADIVNNLTSNVTNKPLSAAQGVALKALIDAITVPTKLSALAGDATHRTVTDAEKTAWNAKLGQSDLQAATNAALAQAKESGEFDGEDGRGIKSIARTSGTGAAGTTDTYTITYTDNTTSTFTVYNGKNGTNGKDYVLTELDKEEIAALAAIKIKEGGVIGVIDKNNNVILSGNLADGTYTFKYENEDGTYTDIGTLEIGAIPAPEPTYTNLANPASADWLVGKRFNSAGALVDVDSGVNGATTNYIGGDFIAGDIVRVKNMDLTTYRVTVYDSAKTFKITTPLNNNALASYVSNVSVTSSEATFTINADTHLTNGGYIRFCGPLTGTSEDVIITKNEPIA